MTRKKPKANFHLGTRLGPTCLLGLLAGFWAPNLLWAANATLAWDAPSSGNVAGYKVYMGKSTQSYSQVMDAGNQLTFQVTGLTSGVYYFAVTAYDGLGNESSFSQEVATTIIDATSPTIITTTLSATSTTLLKSSTTTTSSTWTTTTVKPSTTSTVKQSTTTTVKRSTTTTTHRHSKTTASSSSTTTLIRTSQVEDYSDSSAVKSVSAAPYRVYIPLIVYSENSSAGPYP